MMAFDELQLERWVATLGATAAEPAPHRRQPVHTCYGGAHLFRADLPAKLGALALRTVDEQLPDGASFATRFGGDQARGEALLAAVREKLRREPVEDYRIDFEDGYGHRPDDEEDGHGAQAGVEVGQALVEGSLPPGIGLRIKALTPATAARGLRTLDRFVAALLDRSGGLVPPGFVVTLPKVESPAEVALLAEVLGLLEHRHGLAAGALRLELMIETPRALVDEEGRLGLGRLVAAAGGRCVAAHFGAYDYTAALGITAAEQRLDHPACDLARQLMQLGLAGAPIAVVDGATTELPVPPHRGADLDEARRQANHRTVGEALSLHYRNVRRALAGGIYQGWDLHPAQLPARYAAVFAFFRDGLEASAQRLRRFVDQAAQASLSGHQFDDAATGQGLLNFFLRGLACGALVEADLAPAGLTALELAPRSFPRLVAARRSRPQGVG